MRNLFGKHQRPSFRFLSIGLISSACGFVSKEILVLHQDKVLLLPLLLVGNSISDYILVRSHLPVQFGLVLHHALRFQYSGLRMQFQILHSLIIQVVLFNRVGNLRYLDTLLHMSRIQLLKTGGT